MNVPRLRPGNIYSGSKTLAVFTNPTELAFKKGNLKNHYPIMWNGVKYADVESAYQENKNKIGPLIENAALITEMIVVKLKTYPILVATISANGGISWLEQCSHWTSAKSKAWEGNGRDSLFLRCLIDAYRTVSIENISWIMQGADSDVVLGGFDGN